MTAPAPAMLRITDGRYGMVEAPVVRSRTFQLTVEEARATPYVVTGMYLLHARYFFHYLCVCFI